MSIIGINNCFIINSLVKRVNKVCYLTKLKLAKFLKNASLGLNRCDWVDFRI